jgi:PAS domain S-box-containing protein
MSEPIRILFVAPTRTDRAATLLEREDERFTAETAADGTRGLARLATGEFDCVVSEYDLPDADGIEFLESVRAEHPDLPFVLHTATGSEAVASDAIAAGVSDYLPKESDGKGYERLASSIDEAVTHARTRDRRHGRRRGLERATTPLDVLFENSPDMIDIHDAEGTVIDVNRRFCEAFGQPEDELVGRKVWEIDRRIDPEELREIWAGMDAGERVKLETEFLRGDGSSLPVEVHVVRLPIDGEDRFMVVSRDITTRKEHERRLRRQNECLDEFASVVSHDLRNPLNVATARLELARTECDNEHLDRIENAHDRIERIIEDVLRLARDGRDIGPTEPVDLCGAIEAAWRIVADDRAGVEMVVADEGMGIVEADDDRLRQLLENLFRNAIEHGGEDVTVTVAGSADGFYVEDTGPGIPENEREAAFDTGYSTSAGTGFGLSIVERVVDAHGWEITITEGTDGGARFEITGVEFTER